MNKKDLGLLVLILVVGVGVYLRNPLFLSPNNLANTANLIGLFGLFSIAQGFVIITGGIELSVGSMIALLGVLFVDMVGRLGVPWPIAAAIVMALGLLLGLAHGLLITKLRMQPFVVTLCGLLIYRGASRSVRREKAAEALRLVGLEGREHHAPSELSGGQQQRVAIARAIVADPLVLLADEPTGNLDTARSREVMELLTRLNTERGLTIIMVTHEPDMAEFAHRTLRFVDGRIDSELLEAVH